MKLSEDNHIHTTSNMLEGGSIKSKLQKILEEHKLLGINFRSPLAR